MLVRVDVRAPGFEEAVEALGVGPRGRVQSFVTARVLFHMQSYMPWRSGVTARSLTTQASPASIVVDAPYARYLYMGSKMRDPDGGGPFPIRDSAGGLAGFRYRKGAHPVATGVPLAYTHKTNPAAGDHWDRTLMQEQGAAIAAEAEEFARRQG